MTQVLRTNMHVRNGYCSSRHMLYKAKILYHYSIFDTNYSQNLRSHDYIWAKNQNTLPPFNSSLKTMLEYFRIDLHS